ncbi:MAG: polysaccharide biosynthesis tyrosine autokinase [Cyanobacteria bacterium REEB459]|nr:polysaccharide biosynthesis tyrosine autokinase [Cyanobacteria bacterium REEB459]
MHSSHQSTVNSTVNAVAYPPVTAEVLVAPPPQANPVIDEDDIDLDRLWAALRRRWLPALLVFSAVSSLVTLAGFKETPIYQAKGQLLFKARDRTADLTGIAANNPLISLTNNSNPIDTQIGMLQTQVTIDRVVEALKKDDQASNLTTERFLKKLNLTNDKKTDIITLTYRSPDPQQAKRAIDSLMNIYVKQQRQDNRAETTAAREFLEQQLPLAEAEANRATEALKDFKQKYQLLDLAAEIGATTTNLEANNQQITQINSTLADTEARFRILASQIGRDPKTALALTALSQADGIKQVLSQYQQLETTLASERVRFQDNHPRIVDLNNQLGNLRRILNQRIQTITGQNNLLPNVNLQLGDIETKLVGDYLGINAQRQGLEQQLKVLVKAQVLKQKRAITLPQLEQQQQQINRWVETAQSTYTLLLQRYQEARIAENQNVGNVRIIQPAVVESKPVSPQKTRKMATGVAVGALLAALTVLILERLDRTIKSTKEVEEAYRFPLVGTVPVYDSVLDADYKKRRGAVNWQQDDLAQDDLANGAKTGVLTRQLAQFQWAESFHAIRTNLAYVGLPKQDGIKLLITSAMPNEGKSTVSVNLATIYASMGKQVLVVDADIRRPSQHKLWGVDNYNGLTDVLAGNASLQEAIKEVAPGVDLLSAGTIPPNPLVLLEDGQLPALLDRLASQYYMVIIDSPPVNAVIDPLILYRYADGLLMVARPQVITFETASLARDKLKQLHCTVNGLIINGVTKSDSYYYYNYYDYRYGETNGQQDPG